MSYSSRLSRCFSLKTAFLKWIFEADPVGASSGFPGNEKNQASFSRDQSHSRTHTTCSHTSDTGLTSMQTCITSIKWKYFVIFLRAVAQSHNFGEKKKIMTISLRGVAQTHNFLKKKNRSLFLECSITGDTSLTSMYTCITSIKWNYFVIFLRAVAQSHNFEEKKIMTILLRAVAQLHNFEEK